MSNNVYHKLRNIQSELKAPKGQYNSFGKYNYRSCEDILEALKPLLNKHNATLIINDEIQQTGERFYIKATVTFIDIETGEKIETNAFAREEENKKGMDGSQVTGASSSYARKYALNGLFCIDDTKDSDTTNTHGKDSPQKQTQKTKDNALELVQKYMTKAKMAPTDLAGYIQSTFGEGKSWIKLTQQEKNKVVEHLKQLAG